MATKYPNQVTNLHLLTRILEACPIPMAINDNAANINYVNSAFTDTFGYQLSDIPHLQDWWDRAYPDHLYQQYVINEWGARLKSSLESKTPFLPLHIKVASANGELKKAIALAAELTDDYQGFHLVVLFDITQQALIQEQLSQTSNLLQNIIETLPVRIFWKDLNSRYIGCNTQFANDAGLAHPEQLIGKTDYELSWSDQANLYREDDLSVMQLVQHKLGYEEPQTTPDGQKIWLRTSKVPLLDNAKRVTGVLGMYEDISLQKASELKYQTILDTLYDGFFVTDIDGHLLEANPALCNMLGYTTKEISLLNIKQLEANNNTTTAKHIAKTLQIGHTRFETRYQHKQGLMINVEVSLSIDSSSPNRLIAFVQDISERIKAAEIEQRRAKILEKMSRNTPLNELIENIANSLCHAQPNLRCDIIINDEFENYAFTGSGCSESVAHCIYTSELSLANRNENCCSAGFSGKRSQQAVYKDPVARQHSPDVNRVCISEPIMSRDNQKVVGVIAIDYEANYQVTADDLSLIEQTATLASLAIDQAQNLQQLNLANMVYQHSGEAMLITDADGFIINVNPAFSKHTGYALEEVKGKKTSLLQSGQHDTAFYQALWKTLEKTGNWQGEIWNKRKNGDIFIERLSITTIYDDHGQPYRRIALFDDISEYKKQEQLIWQQANYDALTGLPNRNMFYDRLNRSIIKADNHHLPVGLFFIDLDHFKEVNDTLGHNVGDELLKEVTNRLFNVIPDAITVARIGGDEFTVIIEDLTEKEHLEDLANQIILELSRPYLLNNHRHFLTASIGISIYPTDASNAVELVKNADQAMYFAKNSGRNRFNYFTADLQNAAQSRYQTINQLHVALEKNEFQLFYQPIIDLTTGAIHKAEALIRWLHPNKGFISPAEFIPVAEEAGIILDIGEWVFNTAINQVVKLRELDTSFQISINASPIQFQRKPQLAQNWANKLQQVGLTGSAITVEITEGLLMDISSDVQNHLHIFQQQGIAISLDDFGTGYSSLSYLKKFDIDFLKIDQTFVRNITNDNNDLILCEAIITMAHKLGLKVVAEGIETEDHAKILQDIGCDYGQGYFYAKPMPATAMTTLIEGQVSDTMCN